MLTPEQISVLRDISGQLTDPIVEFLIADIADRISEAGQLTSTASYEIWKAQKLGVSQKQLKKELQKRLKVSRGLLEQLLTQAAEVGYDFDLKRFPSADAVSFDDNASLQQILDAAIQQAQEDFTNITQTMGFVGPNGKAMELTEAYQKACDFVFEKVATGAQDYNSAIRTATKGLAEKGILSLDYTSGVHRSVETAVRLNTMSSLGIMTEQITQRNHDALGCDGWEISAHMGSAPDHEPIQGKQYSDEDYTRLNNSLVRRIGTLNCGHSAMPVILGVNDPQYTAEELEEFREMNEAGITYEGKHYTLYEASQRQRRLETSIRNYKRRILIDEHLGGKDALQNDQIRLVRLREEYNRFSKATGLPMQHERMEAAGFTWKHGKAAEKTAQDVFKNPPNNLKELSAKIDKALDGYCIRSSKWSGKTIVLTREQMPKANGRKEWNCDISLRDSAKFKTVVHEHLHARSVSYYGPETYLRHQSAEEGTVELFAREICRKNGVKFKGAYSEQVQPLCIINNILRNGDRYSFAKQLFDIPLPERYNWLRAQANELILTGKLSKKTVKSLNDAVEFFSPKDVK